MISQQAMSKVDWWKLIVASYFNDNKQQNKVINWIEGHYVVQLQPHQYVLKNWSMQFLSKQTPPFQTQSFRKSTKHDFCSTLVVIWGVLQFPGNISLLPYPCLFLQTFLWTFSSWIMKRTFISSFMQCIMVIFARTCRENLLHRFICRPFLAHNYRYKKSYDFLVSGWKRE